ncbi:MAG TPA: ACT domain-containing protein [Actinomycetota bacterium]|jgi:hypothetical protein|nr:ACT domain-containing protein [Actinomycetota bacterium]
MLEEILVAVDDRPGLLAEVGEVLGSARVNIETLSVATFSGKGTIRLVVDDGEEAAEVLKKNGFDVLHSRPVIAVTLDDRPGELGRYCRKLADSGVSVSAVYLARRDAGETELIFSVDKPETASQL